MRYIHQVDIIAKLAEQRDKKARLEAELAEIDTEIRHLVRDGFDAGLTASKMAAAAGLSAPRMYQIRDGRRK
ncbi:hypothetical protein EV641_109154 [Rhodococcus sp. SMB37]|nr:hypothetical protein EV641_109154 [Rhodococcus sp. SMB37]